MKLYNLLTAIALFGYNNSRGKKLNISLLDGRPKVLGEIMVIIMVMMVLSISSTAKAQMQDNWYRTLSTMQSDTLFLAEGDAAQGSYFIRTKFLGNDVADKVVWTKGGFDIPFEGTLKVASRGTSCSEAIAMMSINLYHVDTTIYSEYVFLCEGPFTTVTFGPGSWSGLLASFDSMSISEIYSPGSTSFPELGIDFDNFRVVLDGQDIIFYDGGEYGSISGTIFSDTNSNGAQDVGEEGLGGWLLFLEGSYIDTATTQDDGSFAFTQVPRGTYTVMPENRGCLNTVPPTYSVNVTISSDTLHPKFNWGLVCQDGYRVNKRWNIVSLPRKVVDGAKTSVFPSAVSQAFAFTSSGYEASDTLVVGKGYWLKFPLDQIVVIPGDTVWIDTVEVEEGWNLIGTPTLALAAANIASNPPGLITSQFYGYNTGYHTADTLEPAKGYWVKVNQAGWLMLNTLASAMSGNRIQIVPTDELPPAPPAGLEIRNQQHKIPKDFSLEQNWPNPFNPLTNIAYRIENQEFVLLKIYNVLGQEVATLVNGEQTAGEYKITWNAAGLPSGIYFYRLQAGINIAIKKMLLVW